MIEPDRYHFDIFWGTNYSEYFGTVSMNVRNPTDKQLRERAMNEYPWLRDHNIDFIVTKQHPELWHSYI